LGISKYDVVKYLKNLVKDSNNRLIK